MRFFMSCVLAFIFCGCAPKDHSPVSPEESAFLLRGTQVLADKRANHERAVLGLELLNAAGNTLGYCTSVLIRPDVILTAGHCFDPHSVAGIKSARVQPTTNLSTASPTDPGARTVVKQILHPKFDSLGVDVKGVHYPRTDHDLALGILDRPVDPAIAPQPLIDADVQLLPSQKILVYGFGRSVDYDEPTNSNVARWFLTLQRGVLSLSGEMLNNRIVTQLFSQSSLCQGDSGGPGFFLPAKPNPVATVATINSATKGPLNPALKLRMCNGQSVMQPIAPSRAWIDQVLSESGR